MATSPVIVQTFRASARSEANVRAVWPGAEWSWLQERGARTATPATPRPSSTIGLNMPVIHSPRAGACFATISPASPRRPRRAQPGQQERRNSHGAMSPMPAARYSSDLDLASMLSPRQLPGKRPEMLAPGQECGKGNGEREMANGGWQMANGGWRMADGGWWMTNARPT